MNSVEFLKSLRNSNKKAYNTLIKFPNFDFFDEDVNSVYEFYKVFLKKDTIEILSGKDFTKQKIKVYLEYCNKVYTRRFKYKYDVSHLSFLASSFLLNNIQIYFIESSLVEFSGNILYTEKQMTLNSLQFVLDKLNSEEKTLDEYLNEHVTEKVEISVEGTIDTSKEVIEEPNIETSEVEVYSNTEKLLEVTNKIVEDLVQNTNTTTKVVESENRIDSDTLVKVKDTYISNVEEKTLEQTATEDFYLADNQKLSTYDEQNISEIEKAVQESLKEIPEENLMCTLEFGGRLRDIKKLYDNHISTELELGLSKEEKANAIFSSTKLNETTNLMLMTPKVLTEEVEVSPEDLNKFGTLKSQQIILDFNMENVEPLYMDSFITETVGKPRKQISLICIGNELLLEPSDKRIDYLRALCVRYNLSCAVYLADSTKDSNHLEISIHKNLKYGV